jgi:ribosomal protein L11 methyltransferase
MMSEDVRWLELSIETDGELAEAISEAIFPYVEGGVALEQRNRRLDDLTTADRWEDEPADGPVIVRAYLPADETLEVRRQRLEQALACLRLIRPVPPPAYRIITQSDWADAWKAGFQPLRIGRRILIVPSWIETPTYDPSRDLLITLDPGMAFGTGLHPTTQLCAAALEDYVKTGMRVLDVGSGSGILSILAAKLGASEVVGVDTDPEAVRAGQENIARNAVGDRVQILQGSHDAATGHYDLVVANILAGVIVSMLAEGLATRAVQFIFSGILDSQKEHVAQAAEHAGLKVSAQRAMNDWVCLICERAENSGDTNTK